MKSGVMALASLLGIGGVQAGAAPGPDAMTVFPLRPADEQFLQNRRSFAARIEMMRHKPPKEVPITVPVLQGMYDGGLAEGIEDQPYWEALGVALGDEIINRFGFEWAVSRDEWGEIPVVAVPKKVIYSSPIDMVFKRVERREAVNIEFLIEETGRVLNERSATDDYQIRN